MDCGQIFSDHRNLLFSIAYRMLGLVMDAEDIVQDCYLKWQSVCDDSIEAPKAYLASIVTRLCIDHLRSARVQRETYIGPWLPAPLPTGESAEQVVIAHDYLSIAFLLMLEKLTPVERAVFLLREVFDYDYDEIGTIIERSTANCRQIMRRARLKLDGDEIRSQLPSTQEQTAIVEQFIELAKTGNINGLINLLTEDAVFVSDGGGKAIAARQPVMGAAGIAQFLVNIYEKFTPQIPDFRTEVRQINGQIAMVAMSGNEIQIVMIPQFDETGLIKGAYSVLNPDKLRHLY